MRTNSAFASSVAAVAAADVVVVLGGGITRLPDGKI